VGEYVIATFRKTLGSARGFLFLQILFGSDFVTFWKLIEKYKDGPATMFVERIKLLKEHSLGQG
jgi:hypothetical protein